MTHSIDEARRGVEQSWSGVLAFAETEQRLSLWEFETKLWFLMLARAARWSDCFWRAKRRGRMRRSTPMRGNATSGRRCARAKWGRALGRCRSAARWAGSWVVRGRRRICHSIGRSDFAVGSVSGW